MGGFWEPEVSIFLVVKRSHKILLLIQQKTEIFHNHKRVLNSLILSSLDVIIQENEEDILYLLQLDFS